VRDLPFRRWRSTDRQFKGHRGRGGRRAEVKAHTEQAEPASSTPPTGAIRSRGHQQPNEHHTPPMLVAELEFVRLLIFRRSPLTQTNRNAQAHSKRLEGELRRAQDKFRRSSERAAAERLSGREREEKLNAALADAEQRLQMLKNEKLAARIFGETEDVDGKGTCFFQAPRSDFLLPICHCCALLMHYTPSHSQYLRQCSRRR